MIASFSNPNNCYLFVQNRSEFITAEGFCQQQGGHLTSIANAFDNMFLSQEAFSAFHDNEADNYWIGGTNELIPGNWSWIDGTPFNYADWMKGQPENISAANAIAVSTTTALWIAENGYDKKPFVCLIPGLTATTASTISTTKHPISCEKDWKYYENTGFCYKAFSNFNITWEDAEKYCYDNFNSHLVSIHDLKESVFVAGMSI
uniref:C-type lectin domain-containing protein n=1 Tax=Panagrolaimus davidi TaxID=227884 RepID=A0A914QKX6_9BILA